MIWTLIMYSCGIIWRRKNKTETRAARMRLFFNKRTFRKDFLAENKVMDKKVAFACRIRNAMRKSKRTLQ